MYRMVTEKLPDISLPTRNLRVDWEDQKLHFPNTPKVFKFFIFKDCDVLY